MIEIPNPIEPENSKFETRKIYKPELDANYIFEIQQ